MPGSKASLKTHFPLVKKSEDKVVKQRSQSLNGSSEIHARIELKAYELFVQRGRVHGKAIQDWIKAENLVLKKFRN